MTRQGEDTGVAPAAVREVGTGAQMIAGLILIVTFAVLIFSVFGGR